MDYLEFIEKERRIHNNQYKNSIVGNSCGRGFFPCDHRCEMCETNKILFKQTNILNLISAASLKTTLSNQKKKET